ncbi:MAG: GNAT family N-acetyltransferase [Bacteroidota bacterium]
MIRLYKNEDRKKIIELLNLNIPKSFAPSEAGDFIEYLDEHLEDYFVVEEKGELIGAGGINYFPENHAARISWDFIHPDAQGKGIGKKLLLHRIAVIKKKADVHQIIVRTSQLAFRFYEKSGFKLDQIKKDFWAPGFDLYLMKIDLK